MMERCPLLLPFLAFLCQSASAATTQSSVEKCENNGWRINDDTCIDLVWVILFWIFIAFLIIICCCCCCLCWFLICCYRRRKHNYDDDKEKLKDKKDKTPPDSGRKPKKPVQDEVNLQEPEEKKEKKRDKRRSMIVQTSKAAGVDTEKAWGGLCREDYDPFVDESTDEYRQAVYNRQKKRDKNKGVVHVKDRIQQTGDPELGSEDGYCRFISNPAESDESHYQKHIEQRELSESNEYKSSKNRGKKTTWRPTGSARTNSKDHKQDDWLYKDPF